jgi:hypothetical protein
LLPENAFDWQTLPILNKARSKWRLGPGQESWTPLALTCLHLPTLFVLRHQEVCWGLHWLEGIGLENRLKWVFQKNNIQSSYTFTLFADLEYLPNTSSIWTQPFWSNSFTWCELTAHYVLMWKFFAVWFDL